MNMNLLKKKQWTVIIYLQLLIVLLIYLYGFFPVKYSSDSNHVRHAKMSRASGPRIIDKLGFIIIDALRDDFILSNLETKYMPFVFSSLINNESCHMSTKAHTPTVTMPRLKAITSGAVSSYIDVLTNFITSRLEEDNFIDNAASKGLKIVFYGDNTWIKLFPNSFLRSEGTNSFYALDYFEVDNNITRHIDKEFQKNDWDVIILHYLGLDHIGHVEGPQSPLVKPKLQEMDDIIKKFFYYFKSLEKEKNLKTMLILTTDHGMKNSGSHGGATYSEVTVPLISVGNPCTVFKGWPDKYMPMQVDIAPTLSVLLGLQIPVNSMGKLIPAFIPTSHADEILKYLELNSLQLSQFKSSQLFDTQLDELRNKTKSWYSSTNKTDEGRKSIIVNYFSYLNGISEEILNSNSDFKLVCLIGGTFLFWIYLIILVRIFINQLPKPHYLVQWFLIFGTILHAISLLSSSFIEEEHQTWYFLWTTFCLLSFFKSYNEKVLSAGDIKFSLPWIVLSFLHRFLRKLNQTGDKWAFQPDIKSFLKSEEGQNWLFPLFLLGIGMPFYCGLKERCPRRQLISYGMSLIGVVTYKIATGCFTTGYLNFYPLSTGSMEACVFWICMSIFTFQTIWNQTSVYLVWLSFASLLLKPHNTILLPLEVFTSKQIYKTYHKSEDFVWNNLAHIWMGYAFYFYQGNGNSLANVDVSSGFAGIQSYNPMYAAIMIAAHTSSGHILAFILSPKSYLVYGSARLVPLTVYCTSLLFQLHHLFIWSVFSPKLLYETNFTLTLLLLMVIYSLHKW